MTTCSRTGCSRKLNKNNTKGVCSQGCDSPDAPAARLAKGLPAKAPRAKAEPVTPVTLDEVKATGSAARFRAVHDAMGMDAEKTLEEFYLSWLDGIRQALES